MRINKKIILLSALTLIGMSNMSFARWSGKTYRVLQVDEWGKNTPVKIVIRNLTGKDARFGWEEHMEGNLEDKIKGYKYEKELISGEKHELKRFKKGRRYRIFWCFNVDEENERCCISGDISTENYKTDKTRAPNEIRLGNESYEIHWDKPFWVKDYTIEPLEKSVTIRTKSCIEQPRDPRRK